MANDLAESGWTPLLLSDDSVPELLIKSCFTANSYAVSITDLRHVWHLSADRRQIFRQALNDDNCSIDPSEGPAQLRILLDKVKSALNNERGTRRILLSSSHSANAISLRVIAPLPSPLEPLQWQLDLPMQSPESLRSDLILPLITISAALHSSTEELRGHLKEKDHVIDKLLDKLEATGTDLGSVFPGIAGLKVPKGKDQRAIVSRHIRGLGYFEDEEWTASFESKLAESRSIHDMFASLTGDLKNAASHQSFKSSISPSWWAQLKSQASLDLNAETGALVEEVASSKESNQAAGDDDDDEGFQRQPTPLAFRRVRDSDLSAPKVSSSASAPSKPVQSNAAEDETTDDEDDADGDDIAASTEPCESRFSAHAVSDASLEQRRPKLGTIGGRASKFTAQTLEKSTSRVDQRAESATTDDEQDMDVDAVTVQRSRSVSSSAPRKSKLGVIGTAGKANSAKPSLTSKTLGKSEKNGADNDDACVSNADNPNEDTRLVRQSQAESSMKASATTPTSSKSEAEKADEERERLKRQLELKAQAPAKKKRRF